VYVIEGDIILVSRAILETLGCIPKTFPQVGQFLTDDEDALTGRAFAVNPDPIGLRSDGTKDPNIQSRTRQMVCYVAKNVYDVPRLYKTCLMLSWERYTRTKSAYNMFYVALKTLYTFHNITHHLPGTTVRLMLQLFTSPNMLNPAPMLPWPVRPATKPTRWVGQDLAHKRWPMRSSGRKM
jgi:hypothetical protein